MIGKFVVHWRGANSPAYIEVEGETPKLFKVKRRVWERGISIWYGYGRQMDKEGALLVYDTEPEAITACERITTLIKQQERESLSLHEKQQAEMTALIAQMKEGGCKDEGH